MVLKSTPILFCLMPCLVFASNLASARQDTVQAISAQPLRQEFITLDAGLYPFGFLSSERTGWYPTYSLRAGFGLPVVASVIIYTHLDYYRFHMSSVGNSSFLPKSARREDIALYAGVVAGNVIEVGCGVYHTVSDKVTMIYYFPTESFPWTNSGWSAYRFFFTFGFLHEFRLSSDLFLPVGLYYRDAGYGSGTGPFLVRVGLGMKL